MSRPNKQETAKRSFCVAAENQAAAMLRALRRPISAPKSWADLEAAVQITLPDDNKRLPFSSAAVEIAAQQWKVNAPARFDALVETHSAADTAEFDSGRRKLSTVTGRKLGEITLLPAQEVAVREAVHTLYDSGKNPKALLITGIGGAGKTFVYAGIVADYLRNRLPTNPISQFQPNRVNRILWLVPKAVVLQTKSELRRAGLAEYVDNHTINVMSYNAVTSKRGELFVQIKKSFQYNINTGEDEEVITREWQLMTLPEIVVCDECQRVRNVDSKVVKYLAALFETKFRPLFLHGSFTPFEKVMHAEFFIISTNAEFFGQRVTHSNFEQFAGAITPAPNKVNKAASERLRQVINGLQIDMPATKWKYVPRNIIEIYDFLNDRDRETAARAAETFFEIRRKLGKEDPQWPMQIALALNAYRHAVEPLRAYQIAEQVYEEVYVKKSCAAGVGFAFCRGLQKVFLHLVEDFKVPMSEIGLIWGGIETVAENMLPTKEELNEITQKMLRGEPLTRLDNRKLKSIVIFEHARTRSDYSKEEQIQEYQKLYGYGLSSSQSMRQREEHRLAFQRGEKKIMLFTLSAGGVGLSMPQDKETLRPRQGWFTPMYNGTEFAQGLCRFPRVSSLSDTIQRICMLKGTVETEHVAPILSNKLASFAALTAHMFQIDISEEAVAKAVCDYKATLTMKAEDIDTNVADEEDDDTEDEGEDEE